MTLDNAPLLVADIGKDLMSKIWAEKVARQLKTFKFWYFVLYHMLGMLIILYSLPGTSKDGGVYASKNGPI